MNELDPPPSLVELVISTRDKDRSGADSIWKKWFNNLYERIKNIVSKDPWITHAIEVIASDYGDVVSIEAANKDLLKFGRNKSVGTGSSTIMTLPSGEVHETYVASDLINSIISDDAADTEEITIEGHTLSGTDFTFVTQTKTLTGTTVASLDTALTRISRIYNNNSNELVGNIYVTETDTYTAGVPDTATKVHLTLEAGEQQSEKASTTMASDEYLIVTSFHGDILEKTSAFVNIDFEMRLFGKVFRHRVSIGTAGTHANHLFCPYFIVPKNSDIRLTAAADGVNTDVAGGIQGVIAKII